MGFFRRHRTLIIVGVLALLSVSAYFLTREEQAPEWVTGNVTRGEVRELVSVSGVIESNAEAVLSFPTTGIVDAVTVREGDMVATNQVLSTLAQADLTAEQQDAYADLLIARANLRELEGGPRIEERQVTETAVEIARTALAQTTEEAAQDVAHAYHTLLSSDLEAVPENPNTEATPPALSGTYACDRAGVYTLEIFRSSAKSGYSFRLSGLESGTFSAYTEAPGALGACGLLVEFIEGESYAGKTFRIDVPNARGASYLTNKQAYETAVADAANAVRDAELALTKAEREAAVLNATPREEELARANATILQGEARIRTIDARLDDRTLRAPFAGTISAIDLIRGEVSTGKTITLIAADQFELSVRIPEIDITRLSPGQRALVRFDARPEETVLATIDFIAAVATEIDGVAYFEATLRFPAPPTWLRSGLNADVDIIVDERTDTLRVPKRFLVTEGDAHHLLFPAGTETRRVPVELVMTGNDGFVAIEGDVREGDTVIAP